LGRWKAKESLRLNLNPGSPSYYHQFKLGLIDPYQAPMILAGSNQSKVYWGDGKGKEMESMRLDLNRGSPR
jgi:hypothetical protein